MHWKPPVISVGEFLSKSTKRNLVFSLQSCNAPAQCNKIQKTKVAIQGLSPALMPLP